MKQDKGKQAANGNRGNL